MAMKKFIRRFFPASRTYIDARLRNSEKKISDEVDRRLEKHFQEEKKYLLEIRDYIKKMDVSERESSRDIFKKIEGENKRTIKDIKTYVDQEFRRREEWSVVEAEDKIKSGDKSVWVIKCPAPEGENRILWGDYPYALALKKYLERLGCFVRLDMKEDWGCPCDADVVLVLRGYHFYRPDRRNSKTVYVMWNISHPDMVTAEEYELYDIVCVASGFYAEKVRQQVKVPVIPLLQCTDTEEFYPLQDEKEKKWDYIFIGNSRGIARNCVMWAVEEKIPFRIWGSGWDYILEEHDRLVEAPYIKNSEIPDLYRSAKVTLNDHWEDMLQKQFINNRIFDALACGLPVISDGCQELQEIFPDAVLYYRTKEEFHHCVEYLNENYDLVKRKVMSQQELIKKEFSFEARAKQLIELVEAFKAGNVL